MRFQVGDIVRLSKNSRMRRECPNDGIITKIEDRDTVIIDFEGYAPRGVGRWGITDLRLVRRE